MHSGRSRNICIQGPLEFKASLINAISELGTRPALALALKMMMLMMMMKMLMLMLIGDDDDSDDDDDDDHDDHEDDGDDEDDDVRTCTGRNSRCQTPMAR